LKVPAEKVVKKEAPKKPAKVDTANEVAIEPKKDVKKPAEAPAKVEEKKVETESATTVTTVEEVTVAPQVEAPAPDPKATEVAAPAPEQAAAPAAAQASTYVVKEGQDILSIAVDFGISPTQLLDANNLKMTDPIKPGDVLKLPAGVKPANAQ
jgi:LysM repeat protein